MWEVVDNRRRDRRFKTHLIFSVSPLEVAVAGDAGTRDPLALVGHTRDVSATGLGLIMPSIQFDDRFTLANKDFTLQIVLDLPAGRTEMVVAPVRHERLDEDDPDGGFLIGAFIIYMTESERARLVKYLHGLG